MDKFKFIDEELDFLRREHLLREEKIFYSSQKNIANIDNRDIYLFSSSNYLSLSEREDLYRAALKIMKNFGMGSGGSRLTTGTSILHKDLESLISDFIGYEKSILFSSGFMANLGVFSILDEDTVVFSDELNHASIIDGIRLSKRKCIIYKHLDYDDLEKKLKNTSNKKFVVSDGVFSMDGDVLNLDRFLEICNKNNALTYVDDAHGFGVLGHGRGICHEFKKRPDIILSTFSKAIGTSGSAISSNSKLIHLLKNKAREYIFSTSSSPFDIAATISAINYLSKNKEEIKRLNENVDYIKKNLAKLNFKFKDHSHIIPIFIGDEKKVMNIFNYLYNEKNIYLSAIRYPAVKKDKAILRLTPMASHSKDDLDYLISALQEIKDLYL